MGIIGTVTRSAVGSIAGPQQAASNVGAFVARAGTTNLGFFPTVAAAKAAVNAARAGQLRWAREDLAAGVEHHVARDTTLDPSDIFGSDLLIWSEVHDNARVLDAASRRIDLLGDRSGNGYNFVQATVARQGTEVDNAVNGYRALSLSQPDAQRMTATLPLAPPFSLIVVTNYLGAGATASSLLSCNGANPWRLGVDVVGRWEYENSLRTVIAAGAAGATPQMLTVRQAATWGEFRIDRASAGGNGNFPAAATSLFLGAATVNPSIAAAWGGRVAALVVMATTDITSVEQAERYVRARFGTP